jgi:hypothetical protein
MSDMPQLPLVAIRRYRGPQLEIIRAHLLQTPDGRCWAIPEDAEIPKTPETVGAIPLDPMQLEEQPTNDGEQKHYLYRTVLHAPPEGTPSPIAIRGRFQ